MTAQPARTALPSFEQLAFGALLALALLWAVSTLSWPFGWDQGIMAWVGDVWRHGGLPYRDAWDIKGPLAYAVYAATELVFGHNLWAIRLVDAAAAFGCGALVGRIVARMGAPRAARWCIPLFVLWHGAGSYWHTAQPDGWAGILITGACLLLLDERPLTAGRTAAIGALIGCAGLVKPPYLAFTLLPLLSIAPRAPGLAPRGLALLAGIAAPIAATVAYFWSRGGLGWLVEVYVRYPAQVYEAFRPSAEARLRGLVEYGVGDPVAVLAIPAAAAGAVLLWRAERRTARIVLAWVATAAFIVILQGRFFLYHWLPLVPALLALGAYAYGRCFEELAHGGGTPALRILIVAALVTSLAHVLVHPAFDMARWAARAAGAIPEERYVEEFGDIPAQDERAAAYLRAHTTDADRVVVFGWNTAIAYEAGRRTVSRFGFSMPLMLGEGTAVRERYREEFLAALEATPPAYIVVAPQSVTLLGRPYQLDDFPAFAAFVRTRYRPEQTYGALVLFRRAAPGEP